MSSVLEIMDAVIEGMGGPTDLGLKEARDAVAELILAAKQAQEVLSWRHFSGDRNDDEAIDADCQLQGAIRKAEGIDD